MSSLICSIWVCLLVAFLIGLLLGWLLSKFFCKKSCDKKLEELKAEYEAEIKTAYEEGETDTKALLADMQALKNRYENKLLDKGIVIDQPEDVIPAIELEAKVEDEVETLEVLPEKTKLEVIAETEDLPEFVLTAKPDVADDLKIISGIGPVMERMLNDLGIYKFEQVAQFSPEDEAWVSKHIETFPDRIYDDHWVKQAKEIVSKA